MGKNELVLFFKTLKTYYPDGNFNTEEWYATFKSFNVNVLFEGLEIWRKGEYGYRAPTSTDIRMLDYVGAHNPDGIFMKAIERNNRIQKTAEEAVEEMRLG